VAPCDFGEIWRQAQGRKQGLKQGCLAAAWVASGWCLGSKFIFLSYQPCSRRLSTTWVQPERFLTMAHVAAQIAAAARSKAETYTSERLELITIVLCWLANNNSYIINSSLYNGINVI